MTYRLGVFFSTLAVVSVAAVARRPARAWPDRRDAGASAAASIDDVLADSFPASDPPPWTPGIVKPAPLPQRDLIQSTTPRQAP